ncbi:hypothetical protein JQC92_00935 [Shewanella sp. 202IG2-18]|uniref:LPD7 domain-containing protein n=1 Tax=Parashewanella hymeniacidonis TaxID=2807618 RepID=UPI0019605785|nr:LPD7 domain-containing protein [Parashewanella hymeniacidonis]MBM7070609.1 hypothetical protein [Parashewanella hymeniacidonis]
MNDDTTLEQPIFLAIPYDQKEQARKAIGQLTDGRSALSYDAQQGLWLAKAGTPHSRIEPWLPKPEQFDTPTHQDPSMELTQVLEAAGFILPEAPLFDGQKHRVATQDDKRGQKSAVYCAYSDGHPAGWYQDHRTHSEPQKWAASFTHSDPLAKLHIKAHQANRRARREIETTKRYQNYAKRCSQAFKLMPPANIDHPYLMKKNVQVFPDVRQDKKGRLVIPLMDENHKVHSLQRISLNGFKCLKKGAQKTDHFFVVGYKPLKDGEPILYAEGYATAASIAEATNRSVVMTVDAGNMPKVAEKLKAHYPNSHHLFLADDDRNNKVNKGIEKAQQAANLTRGTWLCPNFIQEQIEVGLTDFNDLHMSSGLGVVQRQIEYKLQSCCPTQAEKPRAIEYNVIEPEAENIPSFTKTKAANQQLNDQFKPLTKLASSKAVDDKVSATKKVTAQQPKSPLFPEHINQHYLAVDNKYYFSNRPKTLAFIDKGNKLQTKLSHAQVIGDLLSIAKQRNWQEIRLSGTKAFKQQAWLNASVQGMRVRGYRPNEDEIKQLNALKMKEGSKSAMPQEATPINQIESVIDDNKKSLDKTSVLQSAQEFCKALPVEAQQRFLDKVKTKLEIFFKPSTQLPSQSPKQVNPSNTTQHSIYQIKEPQHEQSIEH